MITHTNRTGVLKFVKVDDLDNLFESEKVNIEYLNQCLRKDDDLILDSDTDSE